MAPAPGIVGGSKRRRLGNRNPAMANIEIDRRIEFRIGKFFNNIRSDDAELRCTVGNKGRNVEGAHPDQADIRAIGFEPERAAAFITKGSFGLNSGARKQGQRLFEDAPFGDSEDDRHGHGGAAFTCAPQ